MELVYARPVRLLVAWLLLARSIQPAEIPPRDEWHLLFLQEKPAGYLHHSGRPLADGGYLTLMTQKLVLARGTQRVEIRMETSTEENASGKLVSFHCESELSRMVTKISGRVQGDEILVEQSAGGAAPIHSRIAVDPAAMGPQRAEDEMRRHLSKPGDAFEATLFFPELLKFGKQKAVLGDLERVEFRGDTRRLRRVTMTQDILPGVTIEQWVDENFELQKSTAALMGLKLVTYRSSAEEILRERFSSPPELFFAAAAPARGKSPTGAAEALYRLSAKGERFPLDADSELFKRPGQELVRAEGPQVRVVRVKRVRPPDRVPYPFEVPPELREYLKSTAYLQSDDPDIARTAKEIVQGERDAWQAARKLERWVSDNLRKKNMATTFASAREVLQAREGDCTEHAVLLAALLRAAGLPSRVVGGLVYWGRCFLGHMWTEVHLGSWIPLDATRAPDPVDADRLAFVSSSLEGPNAADLLIALVPVIGNLEIDVLEASR